VTAAPAGEPTGAAPPRVELLWWEGCPSYAEALATLGEEMAALGLDPGSVELRQVVTEKDAAREGFPGSPTIRVDGEDVDGPGEEPIGLTCRVYRLRDGRPSAVPDRTHLQDALSSAIERGRR
jgi:hypothetical protein